MMGREYHGCGEEYDMDRLLRRISSWERGTKNLGEENQDLRLMGVGKNIKF